MAIPKELAIYASEDDFIQRFLIPLLKRLGFYVVNYHGTREHGRDLIFAEIDRFGHIRYLGLQAKYVESVSLGAMRDVIDDCEQAFAVTFDHPQTGAKEYISTFYAVNGGSISDDARERYFGYLKPRHGANAKLMDGKALLVLDRWAAMTRGEHIRASLQSLLIEIAFNRQFSSQIASLSNRYVLSDETAFVPIERLRDLAVSDYVIHPVAPEHIDPVMATQYSQHAREINGGLDYCLFTLTAKDSKDNILRGAIQRMQQLDAMGAAIEQGARKLLADLGPLSGL